MFVSTGAALGICVIAVSNAPLSGAGVPYRLSFSRHLQSSLWIFGLSLRAFTALSQFLPLHGHSVRVFDSENCVCFHSGLPLKDRLWAGGYLCTPAQGRGTDFPPLRAPAQGLLWVKIHVSLRYLLPTLKG